MSREELREREHRPDVSTLCGTLPAMKSLSLLVAILAATACEQKNPYDPNTQAARKPVPPPKVIGIDPDKFDCLKFLSLQEVGQMAGGEVVSEANGSALAAGTPAPCQYILPHKYTEAELKQQAAEDEKRIKKAASGKDTTIADEIAAWGKNLDKVYGYSMDCRANAQKQAVEWMGQIKGKADAHAKDVQVGGKAGVDHIGGQLIFIDDNTPCAVTITAPDEASRLTLAQKVQTKLVLENAPMTPRAVSP